MNPFSQAAASLPDPFRLLWREEVCSTNDEVRSFAEAGMAEGLIVIADHQTAGRGRRGKEWFAPKGQNLSFSLLLKPKELKAFWSRLSLVAGLAVAEGLEKFIPLAEVKWPNDVLVSGKKIAGILVEAGVDFVIVGIGINVNSDDFPDELGATSLKMETGEIVPREEVLLAVAARLAFHAESIESNFAQVIRGVNERCFLAGKTVELTRNDCRERGFVRSIGSGGELLIEIHGRLERLIQADQVRVCE